MSAVFIQNIVSRNVLTEFNEKHQSLNKFNHCHFPSMSLFLCTPRKYDGKRAASAVLEVQCAESVLFSIAPLQY